MEKFIVSARKYRPVTFDTVVGQPGITLTLKNAIRNNHLAQAFLFTGPRGVGKTTTARILAKTINCENISSNVEACNECESCLSFNNGQSLNIYELDAASNNSVDDIRNLVEQVRYPPQMGKYKVYIIDEVHMLSASAFNAFLKTLEEPPSYAIFILATTEKHKIIPTILSRCQIFDFSRISIEDIVKHLKEIAVKENVDAEEDGLHVIAQKADGALRDALSLFDQLVSFAGNQLRYKDVIANLNILDYDYYFKITEEILQGNFSNALLTFNEILNNGFDGHNFINGLAEHFRDLLVCKDEITLSLLQVSQNIKEKYKVQSKACDPSWLLNMLDIAGKTDQSYRASKNQRLLVELMLMKMCTSVSNDLSTSSKKKAEPVIHKNASPEIPQVKAQSKPVAEEVKKEILKHETPSAPVAKEKTTPVPVRKTISISNRVEVQEKVSAVQEEAPQLPAAPFTKEDFKKTWKEFTDTLMKQGKISLHTSMDRVELIEFKEEEEIIFKVESSAIQKTLNEIKSELLAFLRTKLSNHNISLHIIVDAIIPSNAQPYTPTEKFKKFAEQNPLMYELKKKFDLDLEY